MSMSAITITSSLFATRFIVSNSGIDHQRAVVDEQIRIRQYFPSLSVLPNNGNGNINGLMIKRREGLVLLGTGCLVIGNGTDDEAMGKEESSSCMEFSEAVAPSGLSYCDKVVGYGSQATKGQLIKAHYIGKLENGIKFDSSYDRGRPLVFRVGVGEVIKGWDEGIVGGEGIPPMQVGGKRTLRIPPELGYGTRGAGCRGGSCTIPPDSVLIFDVEFVGTT